MASVNKVILVGNVGKDPESRFLPSGQQIVNLSLATSSKRKDKNTGEIIEDTQWHRLTFYERLAEICSEYVKKGSPLYVEGRLKYGKYTGQDGVEKYTTDIVVTELQLLGGRPEGQAQEPRQQRQAPTPAPRTTAQRQAPAGRPASGFDDMDDDIPF